MPTLSNTKHTFHHGDAVWVPHGPDEDFEACLSYSRAKDTPEGTMKVWFICHSSENRFKGTVANELFGYKYSWSFTSGENALDGYYNLRPRSVCTKPKDGD